MKNHELSYVFLAALLPVLVGTACKDREPPQPTTAVAAQNAAPLPSFPAGSNPNIFATLAKRVIPSVVNISTSQRMKNPMQGAPSDDMFRRFFEDFFGPGFGGPGQGRPGPGPAPRQAPKAVSLGTGFVVDASGLILTNNHVVANADEIKINFTEESSEKPTDGEVVGRDAELDVAIIRVKGKRDLVALPLGDSDALEVGEYVMAAGNPFGHGHSVTHGIISAKGRPLPEFPLATYLQTDAAINPGNSGGPLVNLRGEVIGINNAIDARAQGIGFAIPANAVKRVLPQLRSKGSVERAFVGLVVGELTPELAEKIGVPKEIRGPFVTNVTAGDPAEKAGIRPYDVVTEVNGKKITTASELIQGITGAQPGVTVNLKINRAGKEMNFTIKAAKRPGAGEEPRRKESKQPKPPIETGMRLETITPELGRRLGLPHGVLGAVVADIEYGSAADRAGLSRGDIIVDVDRKPIKSAEDFYAIVRDKKGYLLRVLRLDPAGREIFSVVILDLKGR